MSEGQELSRIAQQLDEMRTVAGFRSQDTMDQLTEMITYWDDRRALDFAQHHAEPMRALAEPLRDSLQKLSELSGVLPAIALRLEELVRQAYAEEQAVHDLCRDGARHLDATRHYAAEARSRATHCQTKTGGLQSRAAALGRPPV